MGTFLSASGIIGKRASDVATSLAKYAAAAGGGMTPGGTIEEDDNLVVTGESNGNSTVIYPDDFVEWDEASAFLSQDLQAPVFSFHIHDGDIWMYTLYHNGEVIDQFNPVPEYWEGEVSDEEKNKWKGDASLVAQFVPGLKPSAIEKYLVHWDEDLEPVKAYEDDEYAAEDWQLVDFMRKLGLPFPMDDNWDPTGDTYQLWTEQFPLRQNNSGYDDGSDEAMSKDPWWKFW
jgi:hypothetical protein